MIEFKEKNHIYLLDGMQIPSVTQICEVMTAFLYKDKEKNDYLSQLAMQRGTDVHEICEDLDAGNQVTVGDPELIPYVSAYVKFLGDNKVEWEQIEETIYNGDWNYAGRLDRFGMLNDKPTILDIKTTSSITKQMRLVYAVQLTMYAMALKYWDDVEQYNLAILQLKKDGSYKLTFVEPEVSLAEEIINIYNLLTPKKRR